MKTGPSSCLEEQFGNTSQSQDEVAEWLRRWTANPLCSARVGSNPILVVWLSLWPSAVAQLVKKPPSSLRETWVQSLCGEDVYASLFTPIGQVNGNFFLKSFSKAIHVAITYEGSNRMHFVGKTEGKGLSSKTQENQITENRENFAL